MRVLITGAAGFLGKKLTAAILTAGIIPELGSVAELHLCDMIEPPLPETAENPHAIGVTSHVLDITDRGAVENLFNQPLDLIFHLAAVVSSAAEENLDLGLRVNFDATRTLLEAIIRRGGKTTRLVMASSVAVFGGDLPAELDDLTAPTPQSSYGTQKAMAELLVSDFSRRGLIDGRVLRLPTIVIRPGKPNRAASSFASSLLREPLQGETTICPVPVETELYVMSPRQVIAALLHGAALSGLDFGRNRALMLPGVTVSVAEMIETLRAFGGDAAVARISHQPDAAVKAIVSSWPARFTTLKADQLGFRADADFSAIVQVFIDEDMQGHRG